MAESVDPRKWVDTHGLATKLLQRKDQVTAREVVVCCGLGRDHFKVLAIIVIIAELVLCAIVDIVVKMYDNHWSVITWSGSGLLIVITCIVFAVICCGCSCKESGRRRASSSIGVRPPNFAEKE